MSIEPPSDLGRPSSVTVNLTGHVIGPDDRVIVLLPAAAEPEIIAAAVVEVGHLLGSRGLVIVGDGVQVYSIAPGPDPRCFCRPDSPPYAGCPVHGELGAVAESSACTCRMVPGTELSPPSLVFDHRCPQHGSST